MKEPVIVNENIKTRIKLEGRYDFNTSITIGLAEGGDFYITIDFDDLTIEDFKIVSELSKLAKELSIQSEFFDKEKYNITHIVITKISATSNLSMTWECLSDDPNSYNDLIIE